MVWYLGGRGLLMRSFYRMAASHDLCNKARQNRDPRTDFCDQRFQFAQEVLNALR